MKTITKTLIAVAFIMMLSQADMIETKARITSFRKFNARKIKYKKSKTNTNTKTKTNFHEGGNTPTNQDTDTSNNPGIVKNYKTNNVLIGQFIKSQYQDKISEAVSNFVLNIYSRRNYT